MAAIEALVGPSPSGKTTELLARAASLIGQGVPLEQILVVTAGRDAAQAFKRRLSLVVPGGEQVLASLRCLSARALSMAVLSQPESLERTGRPARAMLDVERTVLVADLRLQGFDKERLSCAQRLLYAAWDAGELVAPEGDSAVYLDLLVRYGVYDVRELGARALDCARALPQLTGRLGAAHVLVDDANFIGPAQLRLAEALCTQELVLAGDPTLANPFFDAAARGSSLAAFLKERCVEPRRLCAPQHKVAAGEPYVVKCSCPEEEDVVCAKTVRHVLDEVAVDLADEFVVASAGNAEAAAHAREGVRVVAPEDLVYPDEVCVAVPHGQWLKEVCQKLKAEHISTVTCTEAQPVAGDPRNIATAANLQSYALLGLASDPASAMSWRVWCALGRSDVSAPAWAGLEAFAKERGVAPVEALALLDAQAPEAFVGAGLLARRYAQGLELARKAARKRGRQLIDAVCPKESPSFTRLCEPVVAQGPAEFMACANLNAVDRGFGGRRWDVRVGIPAAFAGLQTKACVLVGLNEGVVPRADPGIPAALARNESALWGSLIARASKWLTVSLLQGCDAERAQRTGARVKRVKRTSGGDVAMLAPSPVVRGLGSEVPSTASAQQYTSCVLGSTL